MKKDAKILAEIMIELHIFFDSDMKKVATWLSTENLNFGGCSAMDLIRKNKIQKLHNFVMENMT
jgi:hypothetical protein